jgi:hypothetical protein
MSRKFGQRVLGFIGGSKGRRDRKNADGWTKTEMQTFMFATLQTLSKMFILLFL